MHLEKPARVWSSRFASNITLETARQIPVKVRLLRLTQHRVDPRLTLEGQHVQFPHAHSELRVRKVGKLERPFQRGRENLMVQHILARPMVEEHEVGVVALVDDERTQTVTLGAEGRLRQIFSSYVLGRSYEVGITKFFLSRDAVNLELPPCL